MTYTATFPIHFTPKANPEATVTRDTVRYAVLTPRLLRLEYDPRGQFEDRPSLVFWHREQPVPAFECWEENGRFHLKTDHLHLTARADAGPFTADNLSIRVKATGAAWRPGAANPDNLRGTARTLDNTAGVLALEPGLLSRSGWAVVDDSGRPVLDEEGWVQGREAPPEAQDLYFFGHGRDYAGCLREFGRVAGAVPLLPRWALGNWWSRYWTYTDKELLGLMDAFREHDAPLSVCIVDMDWHITETGNSSSGWTGYTWNRDLFPDPPAFIAALHQRGLKTALNLHPAAGVHPHEAAYEAVARRLGVDPESEEPIPFAISDPDFAAAYFEELHHPLEEQGVDFWWLDWQQGTDSAVSGLDPLWWLNHLHFYDQGREGKRPFIFSRWGGLGNHRYPIGFSGDTVVSWESLAFQPYFTATAANVNYGWWSHDIGGHMGGVEDAELFTRWTQFGVFSPIMRLHSTKNPYHERRPWGYDAETERVTRAALQWRHALIPYLYTMSWRNHVAAEPPIRPMYHDYPEQEMAYHCPDQYSFGSELIVAPFLAPADSETRLSRTVVWTPPGEWFGFFDGLGYPGDGWHAVYGGPEDVPVLARAGAIVPLGPREGWNNVAPPSSLEILAFPGADNDFVLYEDDGRHSASHLPIRGEWEGVTQRLTIGPIEGKTDHLPPVREITAVFRGVAAAAEPRMTVNGEVVDCPARYEPQTRSWRVGPVSLTPAEMMTVTLHTPAETLLVGSDYRLAMAQKVLRAARLDTWIKADLAEQLPALLLDPAGLAPYELSLGPAQMRALVEILAGAGHHRRPARQGEGETILLWNNREETAVTYKFVAQDMARQWHAQGEPLPKFAILTVDEEQLRWVDAAERPFPFHSVAHWFGTLPDRFRRERVGDVSLILQLEIGGEGGRVAHLILENGRLSVGEGPHPGAEIAVTTTAETWLDLVNGRRAPFDLFFEGGLQISGDWNRLSRIAGALTLAPPRQYRTDKWKLDFNYLDLLRVKEGKV